MMEPWSKTTARLIKGRVVLDLAERGFLLEWGEKLREVHNRMSERKWIGRLVGDPPEFLQLGRDYWPSGWNQVHYEVLCNRDFLRRGIVDLSLHVEEGLPNQAGVCARLRELLRRYSAGIHEVLAPWTPSIPDSSDRDALKRQIPLASVTVGGICDALEAIMQTESFVDEALFLAGTQTVWRTDFSASDPRIEPNWFGNNSNQRIVPQAGRFGSAAWRMDGSVPNARTDHSEQGVFCLLVTNDQKDLIHNGGRYRICAVVKSRKPAQLTIRGEGHVYGPKGRDIAWPMAFRARQELAEVDRWRCVTWDVAVPPAEEVTGWFAKECGGNKRSIPFDFGKQGIWVILNVETKDPQFLIDSIEIARVWEGSHE